MTNPEKSEIIVVLDRSGSMARIQKDMEGGFNTCIQEQRRALGDRDCRMTLCQFDNEYEVVYAQRPLKDVPPLELVPRGGTALLDAVGRTIDETGARFASLPSFARPGRVMMIIVTDGEENASQRYKSRAVIQAKVKHQREKYNWEFLYLGANQDSFAEAATLGVVYAQNWQPTAYGAATTNALSYGAVCDFVTIGHLSQANQALWTSVNANVQMPAEWLANGYVAPTKL